MPARPGPDEAPCLARGLLVRVGWPIQGVLMTRFLRFLCPVLLLLAVTACGIKNQGLPLGLPLNLAPDVVGNLTEVLRTAGDNREQIRAFLSQYDQDPAMREAAFFLAANLPPSDRPVVSARDLSENLEYAFLARKTLPWGESVPWSLFLNYVLPHRVTQEPLEPWRKRLYEELAPGQANATMLEAARAVNMWAFGQAGFDSTQRWDQNPAMTQRRGFGRCEEQVILLVSALRSLSIPARDAGVSSWQHVNDNHVWAEVWLDGEWRVFEAGKPAAPLTGNAMKSPVVYGVAYGRVQNPEEPVLRQGPGFTLLNLSSRYVPTGTITVQVLDENGQPGAGATVFASTYNYGTFRPGLRLTCDQDGRASFQTGPATYLLSTARQGKADTAFAAWNPDGAEFPAQATLDLRQNRLPQGTVRMRFAQAGPNPNAVNGTSSILKSDGQAADPDLLAQRDRLEQTRLARYTGFKTLAARVGSGEGNQSTVKMLAAARGNFPEAARVLARAEATKSPEFAELVRSLLNEMEPKDLLTFTAPEVLEDVALSLQARAQARAMGLDSDQETFAKYVAAGRIEFESFIFWRKELTPLAQRLFSSGLARGLKKVNELVHGLALTPPSFFGPRPRPQDMVATGFGVAPADKAVLACALLRAAGVPARYAEEWGWVEYFDGQGFRPLYPDLPEGLGNTQATPQAAAYYGEPVEVTLRFFRSGQALTEKEVPYMRAFSISRLTPQGFFDALDESLQGEFSAESQGYVLKLPEGRFWVFAASRNLSGEPLVRMIPLDVSHKTGPISLNLDLHD